MTLDRDLRWLKGTDCCLTVRGLGWFDETGDFSRLPARFRTRVSPGVWANSRCSSGVQICFRSNATELHVQVELQHPSGMAHMPATGQSGRTAAEHAG